MLIVVKYFGPTANRPPRFRASSYGRRPRWFLRDFSLDPMLDAERVAREYAKYLGADPDTVRPLGNLSMDEEAFEAFFPL